MKKRILIHFIVIAVSVTLSCELFNLKPAARENPRDPASEVSVPYIVSISPADGDGGVEPDAVIRSSFSEALDPATVTSESFSVVSAGEAVAGNLEIAGAELTFTASCQLVLDSTNTVSIRKNIKNLKGNSLESDATYSFTCRCGQWEAPLLIETDDAGPAGDPQVAMDSDGNAVAVWRQNDGTRNNIWSNRCSTSGVWGTAELIETDDTSHAEYPQIAVDPAGNAVAVWHQNDGTRNNIWSNRFSPGSDWGTAELIETDDTDSAYNPQVAVDPAGNAVAVWHQSDGTRNNIWSNRCSTSGVWGTADLIENDNAGNAYSPQIVIDSTGNAAAVWKQNDGIRVNIWSNRCSTSGVWGTAELIETDDAGDADAPQIKIDSDGNAVAVWHQNDGTRNNIWSNRCSTSGVWGTAELIETDDTSHAEYPQIAVDPAGNAVAVWHQNDSTRNNIWSNRFRPGSGWGTAELIETDDTSQAGYPQVAVDPAGNAVAVWHQHDGTRNNCWSNRFRPDSGWGTAELIETDDAGDAAPPQVAVDPYGNTVTVWTQNNGTRWNIWSALFR